MKNLIVIVILATAGYFVYANWDKISETVVNSVQNEKTIKAVTEGRQQSNDDANAVLNMNE